MTEKNEIKDLMASLDHEDAQVRLHVVEILQGIGGGQVVEPLSKALLDENVWVRRQAASVLGEVKHPLALDKLLERLFGDDDSEVRIVAVQGLKNYRNAKSFNAIIRALDDDFDTVRGTAAKVLGELEDPQALEPLIRHLNDMNQEVRMEIIIALGNLGNRQAVPALISCLDIDYDSYTPGQRPWAESIPLNTARALAKIGDPRAIAPLEEFMGSERCIFTEETRKAIEHLRASNRDK